MFSLKSLETFFLQWIPSQQTIELYVDFRANETAFF